MGKAPPFREGRVSQSFPVKTPRCNLGVGRTGPCQFFLILASHSGQTFFGVGLRVLVLGLVAFTT